MIKVKGQEYPASFVKLVLADAVINNLESIRNFMGLKNNVEAYTFAVTFTYNSLMKELEKYSKLSNSDSIEQPVDYDKNPLKDTDEDS